MTQPSRHTVRDGLKTLLDTATTLQSVYNGWPGDAVAGQSPIAVIMSNGTNRQHLGRGTSQNNNQFRLELAILVSKDTTSDDDVLDGIDAEIATLISDNRSNATWVFIGYADEFSTIQPANFGGQEYTMETYNIIITVW